VEVVSQSQNRIMQQSFIASKLKKILLFETDLLVTSGRCA